MRALLVQVAAAQNIMVVASKGVFCLSVQRTMALIFVESAMNFHVKKRRDCLTFGARYAIINNKLTYRNLVEEYKKWRKAKLLKRLHLVL